MFPLAESDSSLTVNGETLRARIIESFKAQGLEIQGSRFHWPDEVDKEKLRSIHSEAVQHKIDQRKQGLIKHEPALLRRIASGRDVTPEKIKPGLIEVKPNSEDELLFRYASLHWSIPVSSGYGRRLRYIVVDENTDCLIGVFGLGDPVFSLRCRDNWIDWDIADRRERLHHVVDAYVLGAVPPYSLLLCGKLVAMLAMSNEVRTAFQRKYGAKSSIIRQRKLSGKIALLTTTSALGRSSLYNRIRFNDRLMYESVGYTRGFGEFHFSNGLYNSIIEFARSNSEATAKHELWGSGFRNKREVVRKALSKLELPLGWQNHGIRREMYVAPAARNSREFLAGKDDTLEYYDQSANELFSWFRGRWLLPRSKRDQRYRDWERNEWAIWSDGVSDD